MMDDPAKLAGTETSRWLLDQSERALTDVLAGFEIMANRLRSGEDVPQAEMQKALIALAGTRKSLLDEVKKHEEQVLLAGGLVAEAPLDFDEIRCEVGRHLDRIRDTDRSGEVSEGSVE